MQRRAGCPDPGADQLGEACACCPLCGASGPFTGALVLQAEPRVAMRQCAHSAGASAERFPTGAWLGALYDPAQYPSQMLQSSAATLAYARAIARTVREDNAAPRALRLLDFGGSEGGLSRALIALLGQAGYDDVDACVVDLCTPRQAGRVRFEHVDGFGRMEARHDVLVASAVLEHLTDVPGTVARLARVAADGALLFIRTPWELPLTRVLPRYRLLWPQHLHDMWPEYFERFLATYGLRGELIHSTPFVVESSFRQRPLRTAAAHLLKAPAWMESR